ncbi:YegS/Rv2252/BmrU family lipid kinase [Psychrosphaera sp. B3R10]|uniref:diacylglycerol/lipid kinase family protein n=1 Tax=unclassified Psychrosphaera TaxID=2641570 RepID=UPI001C087D13|nr:MULTISPECIES: YegS/Rv2252/BmrU family lipid kinase [unclassified Psychrosphaera]MBU2883653.1 YegS/Rv2252/BmrU family lipid kinase [Psychrosphaera sp. I2R16]MBU2991003.1 YegS/Rv2252/BmrU family lipid kinase [Psychrosphaera sp. B3R10]
MTARKYLVVFNPLPNRRRTRRLNKLVAKLGQMQFDYTLYPTAPTVSANKIFFAKHHTEYTDVIVVGGDGTFNLMINVLIDYNFNVALMPAGTGNDFARAWYGKNRNNLDYLLNVVTGEENKTIHLGYCEFLGSKTAELVYYHNVLGIGFDAAIAKALRHNKGTVPSLSYLIAALWYIPLYREPECTISYDNKTETYFNFMTAFANSRFFGSGLPIAPKANPEDNSVQMVKLAKQDLWTKLALLVKLLFAKHSGSDHVEIKSMSQPLVVETTGLDIEADGEYLGQSPCKIGVSKQGLRLKQ